jgi:hypothetical protein
MHKNGIVGVFEILVRAMRSDLGQSQWRVLFEWFFGEEASKSTGLSIVEAWHAMFLATASLATKDFLQVWQWFFDRFCIDGAIPNDTSVLYILNGLFDYPEMSELLTTRSILRPSSIFDKRSSLFDSIPKLTYTNIKDDDAQKIKHALDYLCKHFQNPEKNYCGNHVVEKMIKTHQAYQFDVRHDSIVEMACLKFSNQNVLLEFQTTAKEWLHSPFWCEILFIQYLIFLTASKHPMRQHFNQELPLDRIIGETAEQFSDLLACSLEQNFSLSTLPSERRVVETPVEKQNLTLPSSSSSQRFSKIISHERRRIRIGISNDHK